MQKKATTGDEDLDRNIDETLEATFKAIQGRPKLTAKTRRSSPALPDKNSGAEATEAQFLEWLQEAVDRLAKTKPWPMNANQYTYFHSEACWNLRPDLENYAEQIIIDQCDFESEYRTAYESGDGEAIYEFAKANREAIGRDWVTKQLVAWRLSDSPEGKRQFDRFMRAYWSRQGKRSPGKMLDIIRRDQACYKAFLGRNRNNLQSTFLEQYSETHGMSLDSVEEIVKYYNQYYAIWKACPSTRLYLSLKGMPRIRTHLDR
jgi:hypothetical protein